MASLTSQYRKYLRSNGVTLLNNTPMFNVMTASEFEKFTNANKSKEDIINDMYNRLEKINISWLNHLMNGQDDKEITNLAYHCRMNAKRLVDEITNLERA